MHSTGAAPLVCPCSRSNGHKCRAHRELTLGTGDHVANMPNTITLEQHRAMVARSTAA